MTRFKCPTCHIVLKVIDAAAGHKTTCPACGQLMLVPTPVKPAANNPTVLGQFTPSPLPVPATSARVESDSLVLLGLRKDAELEGRNGQPDYKPARSWAGTLCAVLALTLAVAATPLSVIHHPLLGAGLASFGIVLALFAIFKSLFRRGFGLAAIALMVGGSALSSIIILAGGPSGLIEPVKDRLASLHPHDTQERQEALSDRPTLPAYEEAAEKREINQGGSGPTGEDRRKDDAPKRQARRHEETKEEQPSQSKKRVVSPSRMPQAPVPFNPALQIRPDEELPQVNKVPATLPHRAHQGGGTRELTPSKKEPKREKTVVLKDLQLAEARKQSRGERPKEENGTPAVAAASASSKREPSPSPAQKDLPDLPKPTKPQPQTKPPPPTADAIVENRLAADESELLKQLESVPELRLVNDLEVQALRKSAKGKSVIAELHQAMIVAGFRAGLPLRGGAKARLNPSAALVVEQLSKSLRDLGFVSGVPTSGARGRSPQSQENRPLDKVAEFQKWCDDKQIDKANAALPTLLQMLQVEEPPLRLLLVRELAKVKNRDAAIVLTYRALFDLDPEVRDLAVKSLEGRSSNHYLPFLLKALRYPWPPVADHAAQALRKLKTTGIEPQLIKLLEQPDPTMPVPDKKNKKLLLMPELVRLNHMRNCLLCHAPSTNANDGLVRGRVPTPGEPLPPAYYAARSGDFVRADTTFLRQDFSAIMPVEGASPWPAEQRFDFVVCTRVVKPEEMPNITTKKDDNYPQREAVLYALRGLTGKDAGTSAEKWREMLNIAKVAKDNKGDGQDKRTTNKTPAMDESTATKKGQSQ